MGNYCDFEEPTIDPATFPMITRSHNFLQLSWQLLKRHQQLSFITFEQQNEIISYLLSLPHKRNEVKVVEIRPEANIYLAYKYDSYFYLGPIVKDIMEGSGAVALPCNKIFIGEFRNNKIEGKGSVIFEIGERANTKSVKITGEWGYNINGKLQFSNHPHQFSFSIDKDKIKGLKDCKYIQYPNYDEYIGQTFKGLAQGYGRYIYRNGHITREYPCYEGFFQNGVREGRGILRYNDNVELNINWSRGKPDGIGYIIINKTRHTIMYSQGQRLQRLPSSQFE